MAGMSEHTDSARLPNADLDWNNPDILSTAKAMRSVKGGHLKAPVGDVPGSHNWYVVMALLRGERIDDYRKGHGVLNDEGYRINNIRSRIPELKNEWGMPIVSADVEGRDYKEHYLDPTLRRADAPARDNHRARVGQQPPHPAPAQSTPMAPSSAGAALPEFDWEI